LSLLPATLPIDGAGCLPKNTQTDLGIVTRVISGDTVEAIVNGQQVMIGYLGIQAPILPANGKIGGFYAQNAFQRNNQLVNGQIVTLVKDLSTSDSRGRLLRYVIANNLFINYEMVNHGYAISIWPSSDSNCKSEFDASQDAARKSLTGMWLVTPTPLYVPSDH
jgi:micrococcal nuclease